MTRTIWLCVFLWVSLLQVAAQSAKKIILNVQKTPLSLVLLDLKANYGIQFAFDNDILSKYLVSVNRTFDSEEEALNYLLQNIPLELEKSGEIFIIIPVSEDTVVVQPKAFNQVSGQVLESETLEPLPFSYISINNKYIQSDQQGYFNFIASADTSLNLRISHLGYYFYDTVLTQSINSRFLLVPEPEELEEIKVISSLVDQSTLIGDKPGRIKINHRIAPVLPGYGDNTIYNLLRLMPGVLASGESSNDLMIWGSYESQSKIQLDGFTIFGLNNFNDDINVVNPFIVKNIEVMKGGYEARYGDRVGGIVDIVGKDGNLQKPSFGLNVNNTTVNSVAEIPLSKKSTFLAAYRQTYYQLYDRTGLNFSDRQSNNAQMENSVVFDVIPDYKFRDSNAKYVYRGTGGGQLAISIYGGGDNFDYNMEGELINNVLTRTEDEQNRQLGSSVKFFQPWENGNSTTLTASYSVFKREAQEQNKTVNNRTGRERITKQITTENKVDEISINAEHTFSLKNGHHLIFGAGAIQNNVNLVRNSFDEPVINLDSHSPRIVGFVQDELPLGKAVDLNSGLRLIYSTAMNKVYFEPRISASVRVTEEIKLNAAWGMYNQFMSKTSIVDSALNYAWFWINSNATDIPVLHAQHWVGGLAYHKNGLTVSGEVFYKTTDGLTRFYNGGKRFGQGFYVGDAISKGLDVFIKKEYKQHMAWVSYTLSNTMEHFPFYVREEYRPAPHHQKHELKFAGIVNFKSFWFSANYVYGSGFERYNFETDQQIDRDKPYNRLDIALVYRFRPGKVKPELGISVLNVFDTENIKYSNLRRTSVDDVSLVSIYADAVPFTPTLFFNIRF
jgi:hypothetical protein